MGMPEIIARGETSVAVQAPEGQGTGRLSRCDDDDEKSTIHVDNFVHILRMMQPTPLSGPSGRDWLFFELLHNRIRIMMLRNFLAASDGWMRELIKHL
jgi:hypothetical protein